MVHDITERRKAEDSLRASELLYRGLFEHMSEAMVLGEVVLDENGEPFDYVVLDSNETWTKLWGIERDAAKGKRRRDLMPVKDPFFIRVCGEVAATGKPTSYERYSPVTGRWLRCMFTRPVRAVSSSYQSISPNARRKTWSKTSSSAWSLMS
jgi:PAS domain-containing protein